MASTRRKRQTKHRGNAAGVVETRGRTGRKPTASDGKSYGRGKARRADRFSKPPTWRSAFNRAVIAAFVFVLAAIFILGQKPLAGVLFGVFLIVFYTPLTFYTDSFFYRRRQAKLQGRQ